MHILTQRLAAGELNAASIAVWTAVSVFLSVAGGALSGLWLARKDLGSSLAAALGAMYGPVAAVPGILVGLIVLLLLQ
jgi:hypothetical protein